MTWLNNVTWPKAVLLGVIILIVTRIVAPDTAEWILVSIERTIRYVMDAIPTIGG